MAKMTLLEMVQDILSDMVSDEVNDIDDTIESQAVANILKSTYLTMLANRNWPHTRRLLQLEGLGDVNRPNYLRLPTRLKEVVEIKYDVRKQGDLDQLYRTIKYLQPDEFLKLIEHRKESDPRFVKITDFGGAPLLIQNDKAPEYYTSFDDVHIVCDSYDGTVSSTLMQSANTCLAYITPEWDRSNDAIPDLPIDAFPGYLAEAKSACFYNLKQMTNERLELEARRQKIWMSQKAWRTNGEIRMPNYGRKGRR